MSDKNIFNITNNNYLLSKMNGIMIMNVCIMKAEWLSYLVMNMYNLVKTLETYNTNISAIYSVKQKGLPNFIFREIFIKFSVVFFTSRKISRFYHLIKNKDQSLIDPFLLIYNTTFIQ